MARYYDRYRDFKKDGKVLTMPFIKLPTKSSDRRVLTDNKTRFDKLSQQYYGNPYHGWLILQANPQFGGLENNIYDGAVLIIPFPLIPSLQDYKAALENHFYYYGR